MRDRLITASRGSGCTLLEDESGGTAALGYLSAILARGIMATVYQRPQTRTAPASVLGEANARPAFAKSEVSS
jgi:hypothetical protein